MVLVDRQDFPDKRFSNYFLATPPAGTVLPAAGTAAAHDALFTPASYQKLCLTHVHGTEADDTVYDSGNNEPKRGCGHIAFVVYVPVGSDGSRRYVLWPLACVFGNQFGPGQLPTVRVVRARCGAVPCVTPTVLMISV